ncbi:hypothetical protein PMAYCL1PPCAC_16084, partial [Pristionchus mayeri]
GSIFSQSAMAIERYRASYNLGNYETTGRMGGHWLNVIHVAAAVLCCLVHLHMDGSNSAVAHCTMIVYFDAAFFTLLAMFMFICELATMVTLIRLLSRNCRLRDCKDAMLTLSERYQLTENIRMLKLLLPVFWTHCSLGMYGAGLFLLLKFIFPSPETYPLVESRVDTYRRYPSKLTISLLY